MNENLTILCDVDGPILDFVRLCFGLINKPVDKEIIQDYYFIDKLPTLDQRNLRIKLKQHRNWRFEPFVRGASRNLEILKSKSDVRFITSPYSQCENWFEIRYEALSFFGVERADVLFVDASNKHLVHGDIFIDDKLDTVIRWKQHHPEGKAVVFDAPWNQCDEDEAHGILRATWKNMLEVLDI